MIHPIPETMKSPRDSRPGIWPAGIVPGSTFGGIMQIWITRACDLSCLHCTQGSNLGGKPGFITVEQFTTAIKSMEGYPGVIGFFGGNCTLHKDFEELCKIARENFPKDRLGLWSNNLNGHGATCRKTFNPDVSNLNVHMNSAAYDEIRRDWPFAQPKGLNEDSRHSPTMVAMQDMEDMNDDERWELVGNCDVNQRWSALIGVFRGELRGYFCELAAAQAMLHESDRDYPDLGVKIVPGWWNRGMDAFSEQVRFHCFACGHPLRGHGDFAVNGTTEQVSKTHANIYKLKRPHGKTIEIITRRDQLGPKVSAATQYLTTEQS